MVAVSKIDQTYKIPKDPYIVPGGQKNRLVPCPYSRQVNMAGLVLQFVLKQYEVRIGAAWWRQGQIEKDRAIPCPCGRSERSYLHVSVFTCKKA